MTPTVSQNSWKLASLATACKVKPSRRIEPKYSAYLAQTVDGHSLTGVLVKRDEKTIVLRDKEGKEITLAVERFQFDGAKAALAHLQELKSIAADRALSEPEKIAAVRLKLFGTRRTPESSQP